MENRGISPDVEVDMDPSLVRQGHDPQLEKAVDVVLDQLKKNPPPTYRRPASELQSATAEVAGTDEEER